MRNAPSNAMSLASTVPKSVPKGRRVTSYLKWILFDQWFLFALGLLILIASRIQVPQSRQHEKEIVVTEEISSAAFTVSRTCRLSSVELLDIVSGIRKTGLSLLVMLI